ncbi:VRR-NUC domain-containing protein [Schaalia radingae]|uniref:VRR-NUC domain-containing protein n=1 Tax=Schaalia radingae TaxID=131110 RepID=A0ABY0V4X3_9ACTO|nr:VRR-NUC domain-containing protein [Schaalia radingae]SDT85792.1 VRR-NUC domain-containing protein [Schaalia radingae]
MREKTVEQKLALAVKQRGGLPLKFTSPSYAGVPDRLILLPDGHSAFIEVKAPGQHPRPLQQRRIHQLQALGQRVYTISHPNQIRSVLDEIQAS